MKRVFLDASCWVAAAGSPTGGSAEILKLGHLAKLVILATQRVLQEAEENIRDLWGADEIGRFYRAVANLDLELIEPTTAADEAQWAALTTAKDLHVLAAAYKGSADVLVTLDRRHLLTVAVAQGFPIRVQDTHGFFADWYAAMQGANMGEPTTLSPVTDRSLFSLHPEDWVTQRDSHDNLTAYFKHGLRVLLPDCFVAHDLAVYWVPGQMQFPYIGPDNFVSRHQPREEDPTVWLTYEDGPLALVIEVASDATRDKEGEKRKTYAEVLEVPEYVYLDLQHGELRLGRLVGGQYEWVEPDAEGRLWSEQFKVGFVWEEGKRFVRLVAADGTIVAAPLEEVARREEAEAGREEAERRQRVAEEQAAREAQRAVRRAEQEAARAEQEATRAEQEAARAEQEAARTEQEAAQRAAAQQQTRELAAEVERLRRLLEERGRPGNGSPLP